MSDSFKRADDSPISSSQKQKKGFFSGLVLPLVATGLLLLLFFQFYTISQFGAPVAVPYIVPGSTTVDPTTPTDTTTPVVDPTDTTTPVVDPTTPTDPTTVDPAPADPVAQ